MLTAGDEYPIHQTPEPIAFSGSDRNFYDRFFFNGYSDDGSVFFAGAMGVYPHLNVIDGAISILKDGKQHSVHLSKCLEMERMSMQCGPLKVEVIEPLHKVRLILTETEGVSLDVTFTGRSFPIQEPRFTRRQGPRMLMDLTRMTQNGHWDGQLSVDGETVTVAHFGGTRDRSWGVRPIGEPDPQPLIPAMAHQFYWIWTPINFGDRAVFFHVNDDGLGKSWNTKAMLAMDGAGAEGLTHMAACACEVEYVSGTRRAAKGVITMQDENGAEYKVELIPNQTFQMKGIGYAHPKWRHGGFHGAQLAFEREDYTPDELPWNHPENLHIQAVSQCTLTMPDGSVHHGTGSFEQLFMGPHAPSGFKDILDPAV